VEVSVKQGFEGEEERRETEREGGERIVAECRCERAKEEETGSRGASGKSEIEK
jgi:hypothetical protein